jgi:hypothetical protein
MEVNDACMIRIAVARGEIRKLAFVDASL